MLTVTLRSDAASLLLCTVDGPEQVAYDLVADMACRPPGESTEKFRQRLTGALVAASMQVNSYNGFDTGETTGCYTHVTVGDGDVLTDFAMSVGEFKGSERVPRDYHGRWTSGPAGGGDGFRDSPGVGQRTPAQATAERERVADLLKEHPKPNGERARIMRQMDDNGDASTVAEHDRIAGDKWTAERKALHDRIILELLADATRVPHDGKAVLLGGLPGSGKGGVLGKAEVGIDETKYLRIDPDAVKQNLIDKHAITRPDGMTDGEMAAWLHHESTHITDELQKEAMKRGMNLIIDKTMSKSPAAQLDKLSKAGYTVHGIFVDVSIDESLKSADKRWQEGGRFIPPTYIEGSRIDGIDARSKNAAAFASAADLFDDGWQFVTNDGIADRDPKPTFRRGSGKFEFAMAGLTVLRSRPFTFRSVDEVPRDYHGRWTGPGGEGAGEATKNGDIVIDDGRVSVSPAAAVDLIENLGTRPAASDLTKINIEGHPGLFGRVARNTLRRVDMPQIPTDRLDDFASYLGQRGITINHEHVSALELKATQNELDGRKTGQMITAMQRGTMPPADKPVWASSDGYILDGHHRWAAEAVLAAAGVERPPMTIVRVHTPMTQLIGQARAFNQSAGIDSKHHGMTIRPIGLTHEGAIKAWETRHRNGEGAEVSREDSPADSHTTGGVGNGLPGPDEFDAMEKTGGPLGSQGGGWYRDDNGQRYLVKPAQSRTHAMNELTMSVLYDHFGTPVDHTGIFARGDKWYIAKKAIQNPNGKLGKIVGDDVTPELQRQAQEGFGTDALASSWDAYGLVGDNVLTTDGGTLYRIDVGGSGMYRAMGGDKPSFNPGQKWVEPDTLRTSNQGRKLYGDMTDGQAADSLDALNGYDIDMFDAKLARMGVDADVRTRTVATVRDRIDNQLPGIIKRLDRSLTAAAWLPTATFTREGAIKAWQTRDRGNGGDEPMLLTAQQFAKLTPSKRTTTPAEWQSSKAEIAACKKLAADKARNVPQPDEERIAKNRAILERAKTTGRAGGELRGNSQTRRERGEALFAEFDPDGNGSCPCNYCGIKVSPKGRDGHAVMQQDKILTAEEGGSYGTPTNFPNLVPACTGCNSHRNDEPYHIRPKWERKRTRALAAAAGEPRADGREVVAFPLGWDDPDIDTLDTPVQGILEVVDVDTPWGPYEQWRVGGEVVDPATVTDP